MARSPSNPQLVLRPQDLVVLLRLALESGPAPTYAALGAELGLTASEAHAAVERAVAARLAIKDEAGKPSVVRAALKSFVQHGARYCFPATQGGLSRGVPTGYAASPSASRSARAMTHRRYGRGRRERPAAFPSIRCIPASLRRQSATRPWGNCWPCSMRCAAAAPGNRPWRWPCWRSGCSHEPQRPQRLPAGAGG